MMKYGCIYIFGGLKLNLYRFSGSLSKISMVILTCDVWVGGYGGAVGSFGITQWLRV